MTANGHRIEIPVRCRIQRPTSAVEPTITMENVQPPTVFGDSWSGSHKSPAAVNALDNTQKEKSRMKKATAACKAAARTAQP